MVLAEYFSSIPLFGFHIDGSRIFTQRFHTVFQIECLINIGVAGSIFYEEQKYEV